MAIPAILQQLSRGSMAQMAQPVRQMMAAVRSAQNPQLALNQLIMNHPQMKQVMDVISKAGGDPRRAFYELAQQKGVDPQEILDMMK